MLKIFYNEECFEHKLTEKSTTVENLKHELSDKYGIDFERIAIFKGKEELSNEIKLKSGTSLTMIVNIEVLVFSSDKDFHRRFFDPRSTAEDILKLVSGDLKMQMECFKLTMNEVEIAGGTLLSEFSDVVDFFTVTQRESTKPPVIIEVDQTNFMVFVSLVGDRIEDSHSVSVRADSSLAELRRIVSSQLNVNLSMISKLSVRYNVGQTDLGRAEEPANLVEPFTIYVKDINSKSASKIFDLQMKGGQFISEMKLKLRDILSVTPKYIRLFYKEQELNDEQTVSQCQISKNSTVFMRISE